MKKVTISVLALSALLSVVSCKKKTEDNNTVTPTVVVNKTKEISGAIKSNMILTTDTTYTLSGEVTVESGVTLTIQKGTKILGKTKSYLVIKMGAKIMAEGTATEPIVFTSNRNVGERNAGDWAGIVVCGKARSNKNIAGSEDPKIEGGSTTFGTTDAANDADNSGVMKYVRIEYAGYALSPGNELNGLSMYSVGSGSKFSYIQVSHANDDSFEWFGGTVNMDHLIALNTLDDDFDVDNGFSGKVQFALSVRGAYSADQSGSKAFEVDNDGSASDALPRTSAMFANITAVGPRKVAADKASANFIVGAHLRRSSQVSILNSAIVGFPVGVLLDGKKTIPLYDEAKAKFKGNIIAGSSASSQGIVQIRESGQGDLTTLVPADSAKFTATSAANSNGGFFSPFMWFKNNMNTYFKETASLNINATPFNFDVTTSAEAMMYLPTTGSPLLDSKYAAAATDFSAGLEATSFVGCFKNDADKWYTGWSDFSNKK